MKIVQSQGKLQSGHFRKKVGDVLKNIQMKKKKGNSEKDSDEKRKNRFKKRTTHTVR